MKNTKLIFWEIKWDKFYILLLLWALTILWYLLAPSAAPDFLFSDFIFWSASKQQTHSVTYVFFKLSSLSSSSLRPLDVEFMRRLSKVVNIVPVIAKADTLTLEERDYFKQTVRGVCQCAFVDERGCSDGSGAFTNDVKILCVCVCCFSPVALVYLVTISSHHTCKKLQQVV